MVVYIDEDIGYFSSAYWFCNREYCTIICISFYSIAISLSAKNHNEVMEHKWGHSVFEFHRNMKKTRTRKI